MSNDEIDVTNALESIVLCQKRLQGNWSPPINGAPPKTVELLETAKLSRQSELAELLHKQFSGAQELITEVQLILRWVIVGAIVEGALKLFFCAWYDSYFNGQDTLRKQKAAKKGSSCSIKNDIADPDKQTFEKLKTIFMSIDGLGKPYLDKWEIGGEEPIYTKIGGNWQKFLDQVQRNRNLIHTFRDKPVDDIVQLSSAIMKLDDFLAHIESKLPDIPPHE